MTTDSKSRPPSSPVEALERFSACLNAGDLGGALALYLPEAVFRPAPDRDAIRGPEQIREALRALFALQPRIAGEVQRVYEAGDTALVTNRWQLAGTDPTGAPVEMSGTSADVMRRREDGSWGILVDDTRGGA
jgi:ketosteroid isomerase-like protein